MEGKRFRIVYQDDTNIPGAQSPDGRQRRYNLTESTSWSLEHNPGINKEAESHGVSPKRKRSMSCGPVVKGKLGALHDFSSLFSSTSQKGMINEISNSKDFIQRFVEIRKEGNLIFLPGVLAVPRGGTGGSGELNCL